MLFIVACSTKASPTVELNEYWHTDGWRSDAPANRGIDESALKTIMDEAGAELPFLDSLLIISGGYIVHESYFNGYDVTTVHDLASVTKSWTSALVGMAQAQEKLTNMDETLDTLLPDHFARGRYADKADITLEQLLTMRSGIDFEEDEFASGVYGTVEELLGGDSVEFGLKLPMAYEPGQTWHYDSVDSQLISAVFQQAMGDSLQGFAASNLFPALGIDDYVWIEDGTGTTIGGSQLSMRPRDMAKLGLLYLHNGIWDGEQLVPAEWVESSTTAQGDEAFFEPTGQNEAIEWYGYHWWTWKPEWSYGYRSFQAKGYGGQQVWVFPELDLIIATTANMENVSPTAAEEQEEAIISGLINEKIFPLLVDIISD